MASNNLVACLAVLRPRGRAFEIAAALFLLAGPGVAAGAGVEAESLPGAPDPPTLTTSFVEDAVLAALPEVEAGIAEVAAAEEELRAARLLPDLSVELGISRSKARLGNAQSDDPMASVEWALPLPWRFRDGKRLASADVAFAQARLALTRAELRGRVRGLVAELAAAQERVSILEQQRAFSAGLAELLGLRADLGEGRELERLRAEVELGQVERDLSLAQAEAGGVRTTLERLAAGALPRGFRVAERLAVPSGRLDPEETATRASAASPAVAALAAERDSAAAAVGIETAERSPSLVTRAERTTELDTQITAISVGFRLPLWNANRGGIAAARARLRAAEARLEAARRATEADVLRGVLEYEATRSAALRSTVRTIPAAHAARELAEFTFREGETSLLDVLDARRSFQSASLEDLEIRRLAHLVRIRLETLIGGALDDATTAAGTERTSQ